VPGVGKKTAQRLLVELASRLGVPDTAGGVPGGRSAEPAARGAAGDQVRAGAVAARADVREALLGLGYDTEEVLAVLRDLPEGSDSPTLLREALQRLAVGARA
jgi:Holliday junction DNA helicase RuvA